MATFRNLACRCADCPRPATMAVYNDRAKLVGEFCNACGWRRVERLNREEREAGEKVTANG